MDTAKRSGLFGLFNRNRTEASEEEIRSMVDDNQELEEDEKRMIHDVLDLSDARASDVMRPRVDMILTEDCDSIRVAYERMRGTGYSRLPVFHESHDDIVGVVRFKAVVPALLDGRDEDPVSSYMDDAMFVPESKDLMALLREMQSAHQQMAILVDEYGGTAGLITIEDIVEEVVGEIVDETDRHEAVYLRQLAPDQWLIQGSCPCELAQEAGLPLTQSDDYETIAGWLMDTFDCVPSLGDEFTYQGFRFRVLQMRRRRISQLRVSRIVEGLASVEGSSSPVEASAPADSAGTAAYVAASKSVETSVPSAATPEISREVRNE